MRGAVFGAAALLLPVVFHLLHIGHVFMPMYLPLVALGFYATPSVAASTALLVPILSGALTGMPPFYPPVGPIMSLELALMTGLIAWVRRKRTGINTYVVLIPVLLLGRVVNYLLVLAAATVMGLPAGFLAGASLIAGWPGVILMILVIPPMVRQPDSRKQRDSTDSTNEA